MYDELAGITRNYSFQIFRCIKENVLQHWRIDSKAKDVQKYRLRFICSISRMQSKLLEYHA